MKLCSKTTGVRQRPAAKPKKGVQKRPSQPPSKKLTFPADQLCGSNKTQSQQTEEGEVVVKLQEAESSLSKDVKKDPMQELHDDLIVHIISALDPADTETMRRVSRLWKAVSEYHCGNGLLLQHFPAAYPILGNNLTREQANLAYRRRIYRSENLKRGMATRAVDFTNVTDWHIMGERLVYSTKSGGGICVRTLRGSNGQARKFSESTTFNLKKEIAGKKIVILFVQSLKSRDILVTACSKPLSSASSTDAINEDTFLMRISLQEEHMKYYPKDGTGESSYMIEEDNLAFRIELPGQKICRPAVGQDSAYFLQNRSTSTSTSQPRFTKISLADGIILFSNTMPEIKEAGTIHDNGRSFTPASSDDEKASSPGRAIDIPELDRQMSLTKSEDLAIWSDPELRMYIFCTNTGTLLYTYDRCPKSSITMCSANDGFWYSYHRDTILSRYFIHHFCSFSKGQGRVSFGPPFIQYGEIPALMDDGRVHVFVEHERYNLSGSASLGSRVTLDPFTTFRIGTMDESKCRPFRLLIGGQDPMETEVAQNLGFDPGYKDEDYQIMSARDKPYKLVTLGHGSRVLEAEIPFSGSNGDVVQMVNGYLIYSNTTNDQLLLVDFFPEW